MKPANFVFILLLLSPVLFSDYIDSAIKLAYDNEPASVISQVCNRYDTSSPNSDFDAYMYNLRKKNLCFMMVADIKGDPSLCDGIEVPDSDSPIFRGASQSISGPWIEFFEDQKKLCSKQAQASAVVNSQNVSNKFSQVCTSMFVLLGVLVSSFSLSGNLR